MIKIRKIKATKIFKAALKLFHEPNFYLNALFFQNRLNKSKNLEF